MANRKIVNATTTEYDNIIFRSKLEMRIYKALKEANLCPKHEPITFTIWSGFVPTIPFYIKNKRTKKLELDSHKIRDITYTPDIVVETDKDYVIIEVKPAFCNDVYPYKRKLFRMLLEQKRTMNHKPITFAQIGSIKEVNELIILLNKTKNNK